ncbi:MAG: hypothetical protein QXJ93_01660 [Candidatus Rehaiarchaeum fermentans]|nr:hypothetical protein [Candidatus Rehaiarchaeum fermentans]
MIILLFLFILLVIAVFYSPKSKSDRARLFYTFTITFLWNIIWLVLVQSELIDKGIATYGSDAEYYYLQSLNAINSINPFLTALHARLAPFFVFWNTLILKTSPNLSSIWIKLSNVLFVEFILLVIYFWLQEKIENRSVIFNLLLIFGLNGIVTWTVLRELKDTIFVFLMILNLFLTEHLMKRKRNFVLLVFTLCMAVIFHNLRMFAVIFPFAILVIRMIWYPKEFNKNLFILFAAALILLFLFQYKRILWYITGFIYYSGRFREPLTILRSGVFQLLFSPFRFLIGPGPIRALLGSEIFVVTTNVGNILIFLGALEFWLILPLILQMFIFDLRFVWKNFYYSFAPIFITLIYSIIYLGTGDTRLRATTYLLFLPLIILYVDDIYKNNRIKTIALRYLLTAAFTWAGGIVLSLLSLTKI